MTIRLVGIHDATDATLNVSSVKEQQRLLALIDAGEEVDLSSAEEHAAGNAINVLLSFVSRLPAGRRPRISYHGWIGADRYDQFKRLILGAGAVLCMLSIPGKTRVNLSIMAKGRQVVRKGLDTYRVRDWHLRKFYRWFVPEAGDIVVVTGSVPPWAQDAPGWRERTADFVVDLINRIQGAGALAWVDLSLEFLVSVFSTPGVRPDLIKVNRLELLELAKLAKIVPPDTKKLKDDIATTVALLVAQTLLPKGIFVSSFGDYLFARFPDGEAILLKLGLPKSRECVSTVGRGDRVMAGLLLGEILGLGRLATLKGCTTARVAGTTSEPPHEHDAGLAEELDEMVVVYHFFNT